MRGRASTAPIAVALIAAVALAVAACGTSTDEAGTAGDATDTDPTETTAAAVDESAGGDDESAGGDETAADEADQTEGADGSTGALFPDVLAASAQQDGDGTWTFEATLSSPYDTPERYADAWRVVGPDGTVFGVRELAHDHANEQPFTRSQSGIEIPDDVTVVTVEGRDQVSGWGGATVEVELG